MNIKDIVNRDIVNISNCESEPIHIPGSIQPHGFLLAISKEGHFIEYCSDNCTNYTQLLPRDILGKQYSDIFDCEESIKLAEYLSVRDFDASRPYVCTYKDVKYNTTVSFAGDNIILEFEPFPDGSLELPNLYIQTRKFVNVLQDTTGLQELCQAISEEIRNVTGYDRVMVYRFDKDYNGEVYAETKRDDLESFLGLHYPHTDIPPQARQLYLTNLMRMIVDVNYRPVPIVTHHNNAGNTSLDLSYSVLRSVSPIHIEYLRNMGVGATLTISLIQDGKLWGLIACHHYLPKNLPHYVRLTALLQAHFLTSQIKVREITEEHELSKVIDDKLQSLLSVLNNTENVEDYISDPQLQELVNADGVAIVYNEGIYTNGIVPSVDEIKEVATWLSHNLHREFATDSVQSIFPTLKADTTGLLYFPLGSKNGNSIIWFRTEMERTIHWAGEPDKAIIKDEKGLSPRKSFSLWKEIVKGRSREWLSVETNAAAKCAYVLLKQLSLSDTRKEEEIQRKLSERLRLANEELSNLNWIGTHDLKEPLRKIQIFASKMLETNEYDLAPNAVDMVDRMRKSAGRMQNLIEDILNYSRISVNEARLVKVDLNTIFEEVRTEFEDVIKEKNVSLEVDVLPCIDGVPFQVRQLFINLLSNAIKFSKPDVAPHITVSVSIIPDNADNAAAFYKISFADNGIGFNEKYGSVIFKVFQRLNGINIYEGTGIGLAICKKIMEVHNGNIEAYGEDGKGAIFNVYFPIPQ